MKRSSHPNKSTALQGVSSVPDKARRRVLVLGLGSTLGASAPVLAAAPAAIVEPAQAKAESQGYSESEHVRHYYATTRL